MYKNLPPGATYTNVQRDLAGIEGSATAKRGHEIDQYRNAGRLLQTGICVGNLTVCQTCEVGGSNVMCPVAEGLQDYIVAEVLAGDYPPGPSEKTVLIKYLDRRSSAVDGPT